MAEARSTNRITQYWHSPDIPSYIATLLDTFRSLNPWADHQVFDESRANHFIAEHFSEREVQAFGACAVPAMQADYFRYCAVLARGGIYADADMRCVGSLEPLLLKVSRSGTLYRRQNKMVMNDFFVFRSPPREFLRLVLDIATANIEQRVAEDVWLTTGPGIFTYLSRLDDAGSFAAFEASLKADDYEPMQRFGRLMCDTAGSFARVRAAWEEVEISQEAALDGFAQNPDIEFPYKRTAVHWTNVTGSIFRDPIAGTGA